MKVILEIDNNTLEIIQKKGMINSENKIYNVWVASELMDALDNAVALPDNATNGDVIKAMFPLIEVRREISSVSDNIVVRDDSFFGAINRFHTDWWNATYKGRRTRKWQ